MKQQAKILPLHRSPHAGESILRVDGLGKLFAVGDSFLTALQDLDFELAKGEFVCLLGRSGCGKSTLLKILAGFLPPSSGSVLLHGKSVVGPDRDRSFVFQEDALFPWLTVRENVGFGMKGRALKREHIHEEVARFLALTGLSDFADYLPRELSGGMKQRVALARVLILQPKILLMDEPFASLDAQSREEMQNLLLELWLQLGHTVLFVTHDVREAVTLADRVLLMAGHPGRIQEELAVRLPRPRAMEQEDFLAVTRRLYNSLRS